MVCHSPLPPLHFRATQSEPSRLVIAIVRSLDMCPNVETPTPYTQPVGWWITQGRTSQARPSRYPIGVARAQIGRRRSVGPNGRFRGFQKSVTRFVQIAAEVV